ncbi:MAG: hypothetical protein EAZ95_03385 [Bacteroidetes bacterium]|nr:MAG: hypothetical protein EAZ95_03385 [Bacteroidota bacterium]
MQLQINNPCHEKLANMTATEKGRFCAVCEKEVIDFTKFTDAELKAYLAQSKAGGCGTFRKDQLNRTLVQTTPTRPFKTSRWLMSFALLLGACEGDTVGKVALKEDETGKIEVKDNKCVDLSAYPATPETPVLIKGVVETNMGWAGLKVSVKGTRFEATTNSNGQFVIEANFPENTSLEKITLLFTNENGETIAVETDGKDLEQMKRFIINFGKKEGEEVWLEHTNGEYSMINLPTPKTSAWHKIKKMFQKGDVA